MRVPLVCLALLGCALEEEPPPVVCEAGRTTVCVCPGGSEATQACKNNGSGWTACGCPDASADPDASPPDAGDVECSNLGICDAMFGSGYWCDNGRCAPVEYVGEGAHCERVTGTACAEGLFCDVDGDHGPPALCVDI